MKGLRAEIRGIYATALTKLLLDHEFGVVRPSAEIAERFGLEASEADPDLVIRDHYDRQGITILGGTEAIDELTSVLREELFDVVLRRTPEKSCLEAEFPWSAKRKLDEHRRAVVPTVDKHHFYKACGGEISSAADMAESLLMKGRGGDEVRELLMRTIAPHLPFEGSLVSVEQAKLNGTLLRLGEAVIDALEEGSPLRYMREMKGGGVYECLGTAREIGDLSVTEAEPEEYYSITKHYSRSGKLKSTCINFNTPFEVYPSKIRYVDLEVDVCIQPDGEVRMVDEELLDRAAEDGVITKRLRDLVMTKVDELLD